MMAVKTTRPGALGLLSIEEAEAWAEYLEVTRDCGAVRYEEVEPWAFHRLAVKLGVIQAKRRSIEEDDAA